jgi:hypothetical protein
MSQSARPTSGTLHAVLREIEPGSFRAEFSGEIYPDDPDEREIPDFHIGTDADGVKQRVQAMATGLGTTKSCGILSRIEDYYRRNRSGRCVVCA